eukprot:TRINITY_DN1973_c0_g1_i1.p1 TRINITY_DN1973_c0_g1~~TRINITY_DN1973_c0_g1_i1.p1  ORF type:complete len:522 (+),score=171.06 TRINITY_DN1973_c0_g1_i1:80-1645(+)
MFGDDVGALVMDMGTSNTRFGYAGEVEPKIAFPTAVGAIYTDRKGNKLRTGDVDMTRDVSSSSSRSVSASLSSLLSSSSSASSSSSSLSSSSTSSSSSSSLSSLSSSSSASSSSSSSSTALPRKTKPNHVTKNKQYYVGEGVFNYFREHQEIEFPVQYGLVTDWDGVEALWNHASAGVLSVDLREHPVLVSESNYNPYDRRAKLLELLFGKFDVPALFLARSAVLASFSVGRATSLVVDSGGGVTTVVPVQDGFALLRAMKKTRLAGNLLDQWLEQQIVSSKKHQSTPIIPRYRLQRQSDGSGGFKTTELRLPNVTTSYERFMVSEIVRDIKYSVCRVSEAPLELPSSSSSSSSSSSLSSFSSIASLSSLSYQLPDGNNLEIGSERLTVPECIFQPNETALAQLQDDVDSTYRFKGLPHMIQSSIESCDIDIRKELYQGVLVTGGNTLFPGFGSRVQRELAKIIPLAYKTKTIISSGANERKTGVWTGGSILASLGSFHQMWFSKAEYAESGPSLLHRKCP